MAVREESRIVEKDLQRWRLVERFKEALAAEVRVQGGAQGTWADPRRRLEQGDYLGLYLFGLINPVVQTMRGLCGASELERVQREVSGRRVSLGSFSEAQAVVDADLLKRVFERLAAEAAEVADPRQRTLRVVDSTVWQVLPRMTWAYWRPQGGLDNAVRLHVELDLAKGQVSQAKLMRAKTCERAQWQQFVQPGVCHIADRYYGYDYKLLARLQAQGSGFLVRLRVDARWCEQASELLTPDDRNAAVSWAGSVRLGKDGAGPEVRVIQLLGEHESILLATTLPATDFTPAQLAECYRQRWQVELFFRWLKCILGCRHWLAESERGVVVQVYLALIAAQLLMFYRGQRPNKRQMEAIQFYLLGYATLDELLASVTGPATKKS